MREMTRQKGKTETSDSDKAFEKLELLNKRVNNLENDFADLKQLVRKALQQK